MSEQFQIVVVEDEPVIRELLRSMLDGAGIEVSCYPDAASAIQAVRRDPPDLLLLDMVMPGLDGLSLCRVLRADPSCATVPIYMVSASSRRADHDSAKRAGASGYIEKPFRVKQLQAIVEDLRRKREKPSS